MNKFIPHVLDIYEYDNIHEMIFESVPRGYNVPSVFATLNEAHRIPDKTKITLFGYIDGFERKTTRGRNLAIIKAKLYKDGESINLQWTTAGKMASKMEYGLSMKAKKDQLVQVSGKVSSFEINGFIYKYIEQPILSEIISSGTSDQAVIVPEPMYKLKKDIKVLQVQNAFRELIQNFDSINKNSFLPKEIEVALGLRELEEAISYIHGLKPIPMDKFMAFLEYDGFRKRILIEKIWRIMKSSHDTKSISISSEFNYTSNKAIEYIKEITAKLPFQLTNDQKKSIWNMLISFSEKENTKSLVFGDVGSGKTMVALIVSYVLFKFGHQCAILAPTSILANQHFREAVELFEGDNNIFIVHSKTKKKEKDNINKILSKGEPAIVFGTSSINKLEYKNLKVLFIDEEQKFGVHDKEFLNKKFGMHLVYMTATPIPRTLAGAMYTNFNIHKIEEKPALQKDRITKMVTQIDQGEVNFIADRVKSHGDQALVIVPAIASNDLISSKSAEVKYKQMFPNFVISTINGRMKPVNIEKNTEDFMAGKIDLLIATTMVDAGFSNKNLSFVFIENADRFGIAQMHQIRGRVGRADKQGYCYLIPAGDINSLKDKTKNRLVSLVNSENGFELSMKDIEQRGSGDLRGTEQSGSDVNMLEWLKEIEVINEFLEGK